MAMYTAFRGDLLLKESTPKSVWGVLQRLGIVHSFEINNQHPFFKCHRHRHFFTRWNGLPFDDVMQWSDYTGTTIDPNTRRLKFLISFMNYDGEIKQFLNWIRQYIERIDDCRYHYEEMDYPTIVSLIRGVYFYKEDSPPMINDGWGYHM